MVPEFFHAESPLARSLLFESDNSFLGFAFCAAAVTAAYLFADEGREPSRVNRGKGGNIFRFAG